MEYIRDPQKPGASIMRKHQGATLAISLMLLFIITILGISVIQVTQMEEKMSANFQDKLLSFTAAETALREGETWLLNQTLLPQTYSSCPAQPCVQQLHSNVDLAEQSLSWWQANAAAYNTSLPDVSSPPYYMIEFVQFVADSPTLGNSSLKSTGVYYYQITARASGATNNSVTVLQSTIARRF